MRRACLLAFITLTFTIYVPGQDDLVKFATEARSAFVWGSDAPAAATSSTLRDPLTGVEILKLTYAGIEVSSRMGFEKLRPERVGELIAYTTTIVNATRAKVLVRYGAASIDGHIVSPVSTVSATKHLSSKRLKREPNIVEIGKLYCFTSGFLSSENFFSADQLSLELTVEPQTSLTVSTVIEDPRPYPLRCTVEGCNPIGTVRYSIRVGSHDYIFGWPGRKLVNCGR